MDYRCPGCIVPVFIFLFCIAAAGCSGSPAPVPAGTPPATPVATPSPAPFGTGLGQYAALTLSDLPADYQLRDRTPLAWESAGDLAKSLGWRQGYRAAFWRADRRGYPVTEIVHEIAVFPPENINMLFTLEKDAIIAREDDSLLYRIPLPPAGDQGFAWRESRETFRGPVVTYTAIFTKKNVFERITMTGTSTDAELLGSLAAAAAGKIP